MSKSNHTPGPWTVDGPAENQIVWSNRENRICFLAHSDGRNKTRDFANGLLIAAAPDLLAALKMQEDLSQQGILFAPDGAWDRTALARHAAIAKAEGREDLPNTAEGNGNG